MYINEFHKKTVERCLQRIAKLKSMPVNCEEEAKKIAAMHKEIERLYPTSK